MDIGKLVVAQAPRDIETITDEIVQLKQTAGDAILSIGQRLTEAKAILPHGEWLPWLTEKVEFSERSAQTFMKLAREWSNPQTLADLGKSKALTLLALPAEEREQFIAEPHMVNGEEKNVIDMSARELEKAIRERREALEAKEAAEADARIADASRAKMEADMKLVNEQLLAAQDEHTAAQKTIDELKKQVEELKNAPVEVAVMEVDQAAIDKAKAEAVAEIEARLAKEQEKAKKAKEKLDAQKDEISMLRENLDAAKKAANTAAIASDKDMAVFEVLFHQGQENANKMAGMLIKLRSREDKTAAAAVEKAMKALADAIRGAAE